MDHRVICKQRNQHPFILEKYLELRTIDCFGIKVSYSISNDGSGSLFYEGFVRNLKMIFPDRTFKNSLEWCSGPGFLGYSILSQGITENLHLSDIEQSAIDQAKVTAINNGLENKVSFYVSDNWSNIPKTKKFDLIIGDPPFFNYTHYRHEYYNFDSRLFLDTNWEIHRNFFKGAADHLTDDGSIVLLEHASGSGVGTFKDMIEKSQLKIVDHFYQDKVPDCGLWYIHIQKINYD